MQHIFTTPNADPHQQTPEPEAALLISDGVLAVEATLCLPHRLHSHVPLSISAQRLHRAIATEDQAHHTDQTEATHTANQRRATWRKCW